METGAMPLGIIEIPISPGELFDRLTILAIKRRSITAPEKLRYVQREWDDLDKLRRQHVPMDAPLQQLLADLETVNQALWDIEDAIREHERRQDFSASFVELARQVYFKNDRRALLKRHINEHLNSPLKEEKSYAEY
jgi:hypothetical protein